MEARRIKWGAPSPPDAIAIAYPGFRDASLANGPPLVALDTSNPVKVREARDNVDVGALE